LHVGENHDKGGNQTQVRFFRRSARRDLPEIELPRPAL
jgi:hypothetical protein